MRATISLTVSAFISSLAGCGPASERIVPEERLYSEPNSFAVIVEANVEQDDSFCLYYTTAGNQKFSGDRAIWAQFEGRRSSQEIVFALPKGIVPHQVRIDFGVNPRQKDIYLREIRMVYDGFAFVAPGTLIFSYFRPDVRKTDFDASTGLLRGKVVNGKKLAPSLYPKEEILSEQIQLLTQQ